MAQRYPDVYEARKAKGRSTLLGQLLKTQGNPAMPESVRFGLSIESLILGERQNPGVCLASYCKIRNTAEDL